MEPPRRTGAFLFVERTVLGDSSKGYRTIPPLDEKGWARLEAQASKLLEELPDEVEEPWPSRLKPCEHDLATDILCPEADEFGELRDLMEQRPGGERANHYGELLEMHYGTDFRPAPKCGSGFKIEQIAAPSETCHWPGCPELLYAPEKPRGKGKPRKYCQGHQKAAKARTRRLRYAGIKVGMNRNLVYDFDGLKEQDLSGYREVWAQVNTIGR